MRDILETIATVLAVAFLILATWFYLFHVSVNADGTFSIVP